jgi:hypothetical protein
MQLEQTHPLGKKAPRDCYPGQPKGTGAATLKREIDHA